MNWKEQKGKLLAFSAISSVIFMSMFTTLGIQKAEATSLVAKKLNIWTGGASQTVNNDALRNTYIFNGKLTIIDYDGVIKVNETTTSIASVITLGFGRGAQIGNYVYFTGVDGAAHHAYIGKFDANTGAQVALRDLDVTSCTIPYFYYSLSVLNSNLYVSRAGGGGSSPCGPVFVGMDVFDSNLNLISSYSGGSSLGNDQVFDNSTGLIYQAGNNGKIQIFNTGTNSWASDCDPNGSSANPAVAITRYNSKTWISLSADNLVRVMDNSCVQQASIAVTNPRSIEVNTAQGVVYVGLGSTNLVATYSTSDYTNIYNLIVDTNAVQLRASNSESRLFVWTSTGKNLWIWQDGTGAGFGPSGIDCSLPANANILICYLTSQTGGSLGGAGGIISTGFFNIFKNSGIISGTDTNVKTNGVGFMLVAIAMGVMVSMFFIATKGNLTEVPTFVWFISTIAVVGGMTAIGFVDPTFFIISIIVIVDFEVSKVIKNLFA